MDINSPFFSLLLITVLALIVPFITSRIRFIRVPIVIGEIVAGMMIGKSGFNLVHLSPALEFLAEFGFAFLMLLSGLEVSFDILLASPAGERKKVNLKQPVPLAVIMFLLTVLLATSIGFGLSAIDLARSPILMGLILSTTSLGIVVPILKERGATKSPYGQTLLVSALVSDFVTLLLLSIVIAVIGTGLNPELLLFMVLLAGFVAALRVSRWMVNIPFVSRVIQELSHATAQIQVRGAFALLVVWVVLAEFLGVEVILGAFLAGVIISAVSNGRESPLHEKLDAIGYGFFVPIFFITVGAEFDLFSLLESPTALVLVPALIIAAYLVKLLPSFLLRLNYSWREALAGGVLLSSRLSLIIAASSIALDLDVITQATNSAVILVAIVTCTLSPILFSRILPVTTKPKRKGIVIMGTDQLAMMLGDRIDQGEEPVTYIGRDQQRLDYLNERQYKVVMGDPTDVKVLEKAGMKNARVFVAVTNSPETVYEACCLAKDRFEVPVIIARADEQPLVQRLQEFGVQVIQPAMATALAIEGALRFPTAYAMLAGSDEDVEVSDAVLSNPEVAGQPLRQLRMPGNALILGIQRQGEVIVPHGDTVLQLGDTLMLVGSPESVDEACLLLDSSH